MWRHYDIIMESRASIKLLNYIVWSNTYWLLPKSSLYLVWLLRYSRPKQAHFLFSIYLSIYLYILSGTKPQGLFNSASFSHRRPHFNSDRQILRYSVLLGIHYKFIDDWWITSVPAMRLQKWRFSLNREFLLICVWRPFYLWKTAVQSFKLN